MFVALGWLLAAAGVLPVHHMPMSAATRPHGASRVSVWIDRDDPYARGEQAHVYLDVDEPSYVAVFRVDTDGRIRVLFPREPWRESHVGPEEGVEVSGPRGGSAFIVDDDPGIGYLFAVASAEPLDFRAFTRGDYWDDRLIDGGRIQGDPYVRLTDLAAQLVPAGDYDYDISPYYVDRRFDYPRFVCYDCHAYASYNDWDPYRTACTRYRVVIRDDPRYYPYRYGRNVVAQRLAHPGPRYVFRDADPRRPAVSHADGDRRRFDDDAGRTSDDVGGPGSVPAPRLESLRRRDHEVAPETPPARPLIEERHRVDPRREAPHAHEGDDSSRALPDGLRPARPPQTAQPAPQSTGEPELRRRHR
ncbi:MAG: DUF4384 domain-containing protein [Gemmatimonadales bacterium]